MAYTIASKEIEIFHSNESNGTNNLIEMGSQKKIESIIYKR